MSQTNAQTIYLVTSGDSRLAANPDLLAGAGRA